MYLKEGVFMIHFEGIVIENHPEFPDPSEIFLLLENLQLNRKDQVMNIGTGSGLIAIYCAKRTRNVVATDTDPLAIQNALKNIIANRTYNIELKQGYLFEPVQDRKFDLIVMNMLSANNLRDNSYFDNFNQIKEELTNNINNHLLEGGRIQIIHSPTNLEHTILQLEETGFKVEVLYPDDDSSSTGLIIKGGLK